MNYIQGKVKLNVYYNESNAYNILKVKISESDLKLDLFMYEDYVTVTGYFVKPMRGEEIRFYGSFTDHPKYGKQFNAKNYEKLSENSIAGLIEYLSSNLFKGIGVKTATLIADKLGKDAIDKIIKDKDVLKDIPKLTKSLRDSLYDSLIENKASERILIKLYEYELTPTMAMKIYKKYQKETIAILENNPYQLIYDVEGIGFERADYIAKKLGIKDDSPLRIKAIIIYLYNLMGTNYGHTYLTLDQLVDYIFNTLNRNEQIINTEEINDYILELVEEKMFVLENGEITLGSIVYARNTIASKIKELNDHSSSFTDEEINKQIDLFEKLNNIEYTNMQRNAITMSMNSNLQIITGGPGTGKTTVIKGIVFVYSKLKQIPILYDNPLFDIKLIAPTGRAAKRMSESTNLHAETIHRFLGYNFDGEFIFNKDNLVNGEMIIIDEASMIDLFLAMHLFEAIPKTKKVIIVGDEDQLPSVGIGEFLRDIIDSDMINTVKLKTIHRQAEDSNIINLASSINQGIIPGDITKKHHDLYFVNETMNNFQSRLKPIIKYLIKENYSLKEDIQVLIPMYKGEAGIDNTNFNIQDEFNDLKDKYIEHNNRKFYLGDKVLQLSNQVEDGVMNGDQGEVIGITDSKELIVAFDNTEVTYKIGDLINLKHSYAMSIHKSQGSEYKVVIMPIYSSYSIMLKKKLLYTGITRAKELLILIGDMNSFKYGIQKDDDFRQTKLKEVIIDTLVNEKTESVKKTENKKLIKDKLIPFDYLGEENMDGITPYTFMKK
ncbi:ATP-dependent RecD-like DNA helicase [Candidatus Izimaplasma bacterium ZiA1]|uniref:SF1B family DNA helicase RecD2 n=1 Tax=Candidatus Izimoplasma sp. ZiA1 TaxID=2024899 RepID=UPI000BAA542F|nr:ATP-dependent RecD-like DNA helicase [Candidatus Izimaplasma bacterium ZiA1]